MWKQFERMLAESEDDVSLLETSIEDMKELKDVSHKAFLLRASNDKN